LYALYTRDYGKITARASGIRKQEAKLRGHLEPLSLTAVRLINGRNGEKLIGATLINFWEQMRGHETTLRLASYVARRVDEQVFPGERDPALWDLIRKNFIVLDCEDFTDERAERFMREFDAGLSRCLGYAE
ncbi:MAG: recombination protein O N-terminal domain-containing protein, partial [Candidatus Sungiibacteriota bacterium]